jgi:hypothetical protein
MCAVLLAVLMLLSFSAEAAGGLECGFGCTDELRFSGLTLPDQRRSGLSLPLELYRVPALGWGTVPAAQVTPAQLNLRLEPSSWHLQRARPEFKWQGEWGTGAIRLSGHRLRLRLQNLEQTGQLQFTLQPDVVNLEFRWRY